ncbi:hypothetical protein EWM64_g403 [Hericium alpestre]|uniref:Uncharacterized protein n=1 Tax=Hericium alpestre TaxID=135208 RepID=A0A4Z0AB99_9AGAM|nr:hypothetical protein EWM64_g403 [Hericium alpestre]
MSSNKAAGLKAEGNAFYTKKEYQPAIGKYTEAIAVDGKNAVLYCNRAACHLALKDYQKARADSQKATELDPKYSKAWGRLATSFEVPIDAWNKALSSAEPKQQDQYKTALLAALNKLTMNGEQLSEAMMGLTMKTSDDAAKNPPWVLAKQLLPRLERDGNWGSSAFVITFAADQFIDGCRLMKMSKRIMTPMGYAMAGPSGAIEQMSNALIQDQRCFAISDPKWADMWNLQVEMEMRQFGAPNPALSADGIIAEARKMRAEGGFDRVRPAIGILLRVMFMRASVEAGLKSKHAEAVAAYDKVLKVQRWGREEWKNISKDDRGAVFEDTLIRGVRCLRLDSYMQAVQTDKTGRFTFDGLRAEAEDLLNEVRSTPLAVDPEHPRFQTAFSFYPQGQALSMLGMYYNIKGQATRRTELLKKSAKLYFEAAKMYPEDDEMHLWFLQSGLCILFNSGAPLKETMPLLDRIRRLQPIMVKIWKNSALGMQGRDAATQPYLSFEEKIKKDLAAGRVSLEDVRAP